MPLYRRAILGGALALPVAVRRAWAETEPLLLGALYPFSGMLSLFNNAALVRELTRSGPPIAVEVVLAPDASTRSGYAWSSRTGASVELSSGTLAGGTFVVESKRPITLLIPLLRELTGT
ncbi:MAG: hypothetical protein EOO66_20165 [Methylobacterium sp.]|nr:MAG: hypothetical protein EOO66_20165 [Methylobacterium sp.]